MRVGSALFVRVLPCLLSLFAAVSAEAALSVSMVYLRHEIRRPPVLSSLDPVPEDLGLAGARLALADTATTGAFLQQTYRLTVISVPPDGDVLAAARQALAAASIVFLDMPPADQLAVADLPAASDALLFNVSSDARALRDADCRANLLHTLPEEAMRADALMQVLVLRRYLRAVMIVGPRPEDRVLAAALDQAATKFGVTILARKDWTFATDLRRAAGQEVPLLTQDFPDHDILLVADAADDFGRYILHNTWLPRPVAGAAGLRAEGWSPVLEQWGAIQLQQRFQAAAGRAMQPVDFAAWLALRTIGEAVTRTGTADAPALRHHILSPAFALDGFKGRALSYRDWNGQLRQPMAVVNDRALVELAPVEGMMHPLNDLDTLGLDAPESRCSRFREPG